MSASTITVGYPVHRVVKYRPWKNEHSTLMTDFEAACGHKGTLAGQLNVFGRAGNARRLELCERCFPGRNIHTYYPDPERIPE